MKEFDDTFVEMFCNACEKYSDYIAIACDDIQISYKELYMRTEQIIYALSDQGIQENDIVGVMLNRNTDVVAVMIAILRIGAAFLPIDTEFPMERIKYILNDSKCKILIVQQGMSIDIDFEGKIFEIDKNRKLCNNYNDIRKSILSDLAYVIYTSGSTGYPKGVMISNKAFISFIKAISREINFHAGKKILAVTTISFDIAILEILVPLTKGMTVVLANEKIIQNSRMLIEYIKRNKIDMIQMTPTRMSLLLESTRDYNWMMQLSDILVGGERFPEKLLQELKTKTRAKIFNLYGPTETTIWVSVCELTNQEKVSIGQPLSESKMIICNEELIQVEDGIVGEICIGGIQLAKGYIGRDDLTQEKFIDFEERLYKTGDIGKVNENGMIECLGRVDDQVKVRGYRVELNEIAETLLRHEKIKQAVVVIKTGKNDNTYLAVYYQGLEEVPDLEFRDYLKKYLASYMIPDEFIRVEKFPETLNHKIDKKQLCKI